MEEAKTISTELEVSASMIDEEFKNHWDELFRVVVDKKGNGVKVVRHNGIEELCHRENRKQIRMRTGRSSTTVEMGMYGAHLSVFYNIKNKRYINRIMNKIDLAEMRGISAEEMEEARKLIREDNSPIVKSDKRRSILLNKFVEILSKNSVSNDNVAKEWVSEVST